MKRPILALTAAIYIVSSIPYIYGYLRQTPSLRYMGMVFDVVDTAQYFAWMRAFSHGILIPNPMTPEPGAERFFNLQWWLLGMLAYDTPLGPNVVYQGLRVVALGGFALALAWFCQKVLPRHALLAVFTVMLSSGFGWLLVLWKQRSGELRYPFDVHIAEANTVFSAMAFPHLLVASAMMLAIYTLFLTATGERLLRNSVLAMLLTLALGFSHGYDLIPTVLMPAATVGVLVLRERRLSAYVVPAAAIAAGAVIPALYVLSLTRLDATWKGVLSQYGNAGAYTPSPPHLLILLGLPLLLALPQLRPSAWSPFEVPRLFVRVWLIVGFALLYIPTDYQIKMLTGYQVPLGILAAETLAGLRLRRLALPRFPTLQRVAVPLAFVLFISLTNIYLTAWRVVDLRRVEYPYFISIDDERVLNTLGRQAEPGSVVLSSPEMGVFVPVFSDARPFVAHWAQTLRFFERRDQARWFFNGSTTAAERAAFLEANGIDFVVAGPAEAAFAREAQPVELPLEVVSASSTVLYRASSSIGVHP